MSLLPRELEGILVCPACGAPPREASGDGVVCSACEARYPREGDALDLRLRGPKTVQVDFTLEAPLEPPSGAPYTTLPRNPAAEVDFSSMQVPYHLTPELLSHFPRGGPGRLMLDLGCGSGIHRAVAEHAGYGYVGLDYGNPQAMLLGDAHALPFRDQSFDFILSIAVLEHIRYPFVMTREALRVLKPGGKFIGTVAFLEPFHAQSYYHHTHLGTLNSLRYAGFDVEYVAPSREWHVLAAQARMGLFLRMPRLLSRAIVGPVQLLHRLWWKAARLVEPKADEATRVRNHSGMFAFIASRPRG